MKNVLVIIFMLLLSAPLGAQDIIIKKDTTINGTWIIPSTTIIRFETGGYIRGSGVIQGGIIQAAIGQNIFDTMLTIKSFGLYGDRFSCAWFGAKVYQDSYNSIQKSINTCIANGIRNCSLPQGVYNISQSLRICFIYKGAYAGAPIRFFGDGDMWDERTVINYLPLKGFAMGIQVGKGAEISGLTLRGKFQSPTTSGADYYNTPISSYGIDGLYGLVIDYDGTKNQSGSTAVRVKDMKVTGFTYLYAVSPNGFTFNADILSFENIQCGDGRIGFMSSQAQEKGNSVRNITSWGRIHTLISIGQSGKFQAGNYSFDVANVANACIRLFDIRQAGWYSTSITNFFAESIGSIGSLVTGDSKNWPPLSIRNSTFHFATQSICGIQTLLYSNSVDIGFSNCMFRYYGNADTMTFKGIGMFSDCFFSGAIKNATAGSVFLKGGKIQGVVTTLGNPITD